MTALLPKKWRIDAGNCVEVLRLLPEGVLDAVVTDPPYGLSDHDTPDVVNALSAWLRGEPYVHHARGFMGNAWDAFVPGPETWREVLRVMKPGAYLVAFSSTRTVDLLMIALRLAGFEIRDTIHWTYGQGMPKSENLADEHDGEGTGLKPTHEPIVLARKPFKGTVRRNVERHGTGTLAIDASRVTFGGDADERESKRKNQHTDFGSGPREGVIYNELKRDRESYDAAGRWPPNTVLTHSPSCVRVGERTVRTGVIPRAYERANRDGYSGSMPSVASATHHGGQDGTETIPAYDCAADCPVRLLDAQSGKSISRAYAPRSAAAGDGWGAQHTGAEYDDAGGASRFFPTFEWEEKDLEPLPLVYCAKATTSERDLGLAHRKRTRATSKINRGNGTGERFDGAPTAKRANTHPTVKPIALMRWLLRLVTPMARPDLQPLVLDPFAGSGTTIIAATRENIRALGIELDPGHAQLARERVVGDSPLLNQVEVVEVVEAVEPVEAPVLDVADGAGRSA